MNRQFTIEVSALPPAEANPNNKGHWVPKYQANREYNLQVFYAAVSVRNQIKHLEFLAKDIEGNPVVMKKARLDLEFVFPVERGRDEDNMRASFKAGQDALVNAHFIPNDTRKHLTLGFISEVVDKHRAPMTIIRLTEEETDE